MASEEAKVSHRSRKRIKEVKRKARPGEKWALYVGDLKQISSSFS